MGQGRRLLPVASYTLTKVAWVAENEPENAKKIAAICLPHDWLSWRIAGYGPVTEGEDAHLEALFTDRSDASGTIYYDAASNEYRRDLIAMVLEATEGAEAAQSHAEAIVLPTVLGPRDAAPSRPIRPSPARTSKAAACSPPAAATTPWHRWDWAWPSATCPFPWAPPAWPQPSPRTQPTT